MLWVALSNPDYAAWEAPATYVFFLFAQVVWPIYIPFSVWMLEEKAIRKKVLQIFMAAGVLLAAYIIFGIANYGLEAHMESCHIKYGPKYPFGISRTVIYVLVVGTPLFLSGYKRMRVFGVAVLLALAVTVLFYKGFLASVWCFFAAIVSIMIWWVLRGNREKREMT